jgi:hypothetical protein
MGRWNVFSQLASNAKKREGKVSSLGLLFNFIFGFIIISIFVIVVGIVIPSPRVFQTWRRKRRVDYGLEGLKTIGSAHLALALL